MEENKQYSVIGKVEIGTDEYRDLITAKFEAENRADKYMRESWKKDDDIKRVKEENEKLRVELDKLKAFFKKNSANINIDDDRITLFMSMFGEE